MGRRLSLLRTLTREQWRAVFASLLLLPGVQLALRFRGFNRTAAMLASHSQRQAVPADPRDARPLGDAVALVAGRSVVGARCLGRSLVLWFLLRRRGVDAELVIGAEVPRGEGLPAHAWVEVAGEPVNDALDVRERFGSFGLQLPRLTKDGQRV
jgi:Transglutaminase-like superfamily